MITQRQGGGPHIHVCAKYILEKKWDKVCEMKEETRKVVVGSDFFQRNNKSHTDNTQVSLGTTLLLCLGVLQNDRLDISSFCGIYFGTTTTILDSGTLIFLQRDTLQ